VVLGPHPLVRQAAEGPPPGQHVAPQLVGSAGIGVPQGDPDHSDPSAVHPATPSFPGRAAVVWCAFGNTVVSLRGRQCRSSMRRGSREVATDAVPSSRQRPLDGTSIRRDTRHLLLRPCPALRPANWARWKKRRRHGGLRMSLARRRPLADQGTTAVRHCIPRPGSTGFTMGGVSEGDRAGRGFEHPAAFWLGTLACSVGVLLHLPMYYSARDMGYRMAGMHPDVSMVVGMALILLGLPLVLYGVLPRRSGEIKLLAAGIRVRPLDEAPLQARHIVLLAVMTIAITIDVMKPATLSFIAPGVAHEYHLLPADKHSHTPVAWLPLFGIAGTVLGSWLWGSLGDRIGRRSSILFAGVLFVSTSICGTMPSFGWNLFMCFLMGIGAGGMLPVAFALLSETMPARHRGWALVLIGGDVAGAYLLVSWLSARLTPHYSWRILWLIGLPTGLLLIALNRWVPESPRYLLSRGRTAEAEAVMARYGARA